MIVLGRRGVVVLLSDDKRGEFKVRLLRLIAGTAKCCILLCFCIGLYSRDLLG